MAGPWQHPSVVPGTAGRREPEHREPEDALARLHKETPPPHGARRGHRHTRSVLGRRTAVNAPSRRSPGTSLPTLTRFRGTSYGSHLNQPRAQRTAAALQHETCAADGCQTPYRLV